jgi:homoserine O-succinyltransferase/O-acetyltransferase
MNQFGQQPLAAHDLETDRTLVVGFVNNASDRALKSAEAQFMRVLTAASNGIELEVKFFTCPEIPRGERPAGDSDCPYADIAELYDTQLDALIVTGAEPLATALPDEPIWGSLTKLVDWAGDQAIPTIWSCLAAHAAVLHLDGLARSPLPGKLSGLFECNVVAKDHKLMAGLPPSWLTPHSRYNGINADALVASGYEVLSASAEASVDVFLKDAAAPFVFFQGHPEYEGDTLLREYKRDVRRYFTHERDDYPAAPKNYFAPDTEAALDGLRRAALRDRRDPGLLDAVFALVKHKAHPNAWHGPAAQLYTNWLTHIVRDGRHSCRSAQMQTVPGELHRDALAMSAVELSR